MPKPRAPSFEQLCAIAREAIADERSIDDSEWRERIKCTLARRGLLYPRPHVIGDAMDRVERALVRQWGPRPTGVEHHAAPIVERPEARPLSQAEARAALAKMRDRFPEAVRAVASHAMPSGESDLMTTRERYALVSAIEQLRTIQRLRRANRDAEKDTNECAK